jgi:hypothetical protein
METPRVNVTTTNEYVAPTNSDENKEEYADPKEDPNYIPETP